LLHAEYLWGDESLFRDYREKLKALLHCAVGEKKGVDLQDYRRSIERNNIGVSYGRYLANSYFARNVEEFAKYFAFRSFIGPMRKRDLKSSYLKLLQFLMLDLNLYLCEHVSDIDSCKSGLVRNGMLSSVVTEEIEGFIVAIQLERNKRHFAIGKQDDTVDWRNGEIVTLLVSIEKRVIRPFYESLSRLKDGLSLLRQSFFERRLYNLLERYQARLDVNLSPCTIRFIGEFSSENGEPVVELEKNNASSARLLHLPSEWVERMFSSDGQMKNYDENGLGYFELGEEYCMKLVAIDDQNSRAKSNIGFVYRECIVNLVCQWLDQRVLACGMISLYCFKYFSMVYYIIFNPYLFVIFFLFFCFFIYYFIFIFIFILLFYFFVIRKTDISLHCFLFTLR
jgi:hypothetical protein